MDPTTWQQTAFGGLRFYKGTKLEALLIVYIASFGGLRFYKGTKLEYHLADMSRTFGGLRFYKGTKQPSARNKTEREQIYHEHKSNHETIA